MTDRELLELIANQVGHLTKDVSDLKGDVSDVKSEFFELRKDIQKTNSIIDSDIRSKLEVLFDGYKQNSSKLDRIEVEVSKQEEIILKRIK